MDKDGDLVSCRRIVLGLALAGPLVEPRGEDAQEARQWCGAASSRRYTAPLISLAHASYELNPVKNAQ